MTGRALRAVAVALSLGSVALGCGQTTDTAAAASDEDRQCQPAAGCSGNLECVYLFSIEVISDGGVTPEMNYTCHAPCDTTPCPATYGCYTTPAMKKVCVLQSVLATLAGSDGGSP